MRTAEHSARELGSRTARQKLPIQARPYFTHVADGLSLGYRRGKRGGSWIGRSHDSEQGYRYEPLGKANDLLEAVGLSFQEAQDAARVWYGQLAYQDAGEPSTRSYTVGQAMDDYIADRESAKRKRQDRARVIVDSHIKPTLGTLQLNKLTQSKVKAWKDALATTAPRLRTAPGKVQAYREIDVSDPDVLRKRQATANRILTVLKAGLNFAHEHNRTATKGAWENVKPFRKVDLPKIRFMTTDEVTRLIPKCETSFQSLVKAALLTGCRYGELIAMKVEAFDGEQGRVFVADSKNGESRYVELNEEGASHFSDVTFGRDGNETMFLRSNGKPWKATEQKRPMDAACEAAKVENVTFHILRHTFASHAVMNGMPLDVLSAHIGHKDLRITMRHYAHLSDDYKKKLIRANAPSFGFTSKHGPMLVSKAS